MFLRSQFFFFKAYFKLMDRLNCVIFTWNPKLAVFETRESIRSRKICYTLVGLHVLYMCASSYVFLSLKSKEKNLSTLSDAFHLLVVLASWYLLIFRSFYTTKADELICSMNSIILLENRHFSSKKIFHKI